MSAYDDAVAYLDAEVHPRCDYEIYSDMRDIVDEMEAENAKLREQNHWLKKGDILHVLTDQEYVDQCERERLMQVSIDALDKENAKLRTFIRLKETCWKYVGWCDKCPYNGVDDEHDDCNCTVREMANSLARELGIEVDA